MKNWFEVDKQGLAKVLGRKGREFMLFELVQNAWDEVPANGIVECSLTHEGRYALLTVKDNSPDGFKDLRHAYTLFAESAKKSNPEKRGRFNVGEKLVLALCDDVEIITTTGGLLFDETGRHVLRRTTDAGSVIRCCFKVTKADVEAIAKAALQLIPPTGITTTFNGITISVRTPLSIFECDLSTEVSDGEGLLRRAFRKTKVEVYPVLEGEAATLYEMGIPVMETGDKWHYNIMQKVPLTLDRESVLPSFLRSVRVAVINALHKDLTKEDVNSDWVNESIDDANISSEATAKVCDLRYGEKRVVFDPSDPEANKIAVTQGYTVVHGGMLSSSAWENIRKSSAILPAGQVTPSPKPFSPDGKPLELLEPDEYLSRFADYAKVFARETIGVKIRVLFTPCREWKCSAAYGPDGLLYLNVGSLGRDWFNINTNREQIDALLIHEFAHQFEGDHLSRNYYATLCRIGAAAVAAVRRGVL